MMAIGALLSTFAGAWLVYLASPRRLLLQTRRRAQLMRCAGGVLIAIGTAIWLAVAGTGAGLAAALTVLMLAWVALPYFAWWRQRALPLRTTRR